MVNVKCLKPPPRRTTYWSVQNSRERGRERENGRERESEKDVRESLLKYLGLRPPKAELYEIYKKFKSHAIYKITTSCNMK